VSKHLSRFFEQKCETTIQFRDGYPRSSAEARKKMRHRTHHISASAFESSAETNSRTLSIHLELPRWAKS
jgi:hypothetical protein